MIIYMKEDFKDETPSLISSEEITLVSSPCQIKYLKKKELENIFFLFIDNFDNKIVKEEILDEIFMNLKIELVIIKTNDDSKIFDIFNFYKVPFICLNN